MLELQHIKKTYHVAGIETKALDDISITFRDQEFVAILGTSGSGKTTCLNIVGGLDRYDSGDMTIKGKHTRDFRDSDWDAYRNNSVGFVFQSYNLIPHLSIVANVEIGMTLSGVSPSEKRRRALQVLEEVGLKEHLHKKPNQLSGGQMQRVAIARALANDPEILLCDEPTGALDSATSTQIMNLIKEVAKDRLVIIVTHNREIAEEYADRIVRFHDGKIIDDTNPYTPEEKSDQFKLRKTSMSFFTALRLSFANIRSKKGRTALTSFASSIGIIGIAVILSLSTGFKKQIDLFQQDAMSEFPIIISQTAMNVDEETMLQLREEMQDQVRGTAEFADADAVYLYDPTENALVHRNIFTDEFMEYMKDIDPEICRSIGYTRIVGMNMIRKTPDGYRPVNWNGTPVQSGGGMTSMSSMGLSSYPKMLREEDGSYLENSYDLLAGEYPRSETDLVLVLDTKNRVDSAILKNLGFDVEGQDRIAFDKLIGTEIKIITNDVYYAKAPQGVYFPNQNYQEMYESDRNITIRISGIVRQKEQVKIPLLSPGIAYSDELSERVIESALDSEIVKAQQSSANHIMTGQPFATAEEKEQFISYLGGNAAPYMVLVFPDNFENKDAVLAYLDEFNEGRAAEDKIVHTDLAGTMSNMTGGIMDAITIVLIAFAAISLVVSLIMIAILTYTSVLERTKEIGILRSLGARKKDITRVFDAETCILGVFSGVLGVALAYLATIPINSLLYRLTELSNVATLKLHYAVLLVAISTVLTMLGGHIPAKMASKKDTVEALRAE